MPQCPQCQKQLRELSRRCPSCQADLDLLVDYVSHLQGGLERAENLTRAGELGQAMWTYLEILEVDPDNAAAKRQVGQVTAAVRQFDSVAPGRHWLGSIRAGGANDAEKERLRMLLRWSLLGAVLLVVFMVGLIVGGFAPRRDADEDTDRRQAPPIMKPDNALGHTA